MGRLDIGPRYSRRVNKPLVVLAAAVGATCSAYAADYTQLVDSNPVPPLTAPEASSRAAIVGSAIKLAIQAGPAFNRSVVFGELQKTFSAALKDGLEQATQQGQAGVLLRQRVYEQTTESGPFYSFGGGPGAWLVGVGMDPDSACYASGCDKPAISAGIPPSGARVTSSSGYVWVQPEKGGYTVSNYRADRLEERARVARATTESQAAYERTMAASAVKGYAQALEQRIRDTEDRKAVQQLLKSRDEAMGQLQSVEKKLAEELRKAERAAKTSATLNAIAGALSLASTVAMASASLGEDLSKSPDAPFASKEAVLDSVKKYGERSGLAVKALEIQRNTFRDSATGSTLQLFQIGVKYDMKQPPLKLP
jgi:hypothetical protein